MGTLLCIAEDVLELKSELELKTGSRLNLTHANPCDVLGSLPSRLLSPARMSRGTIVGSSTSFERALKIQKKLNISFSLSSSLTTWSA